MKSQRDQLKDNLDEYESIYTKLQNSKKYGVTTIRRTSRRYRFKRK